MESFCDEELIDPSAAATCELIGALCAEQGKHFRECAERLYGGLISDTVNFTIGSVSERTLRVAAYLFSFGVDAVKLNMQQFGTSLRDFRYESHLRASMQMRGSLAWVIASRRDFVSYGLQFSEAKEKVFVMAGIREIAVWALFTQMNEDDAHPLYSCSLRSRTVALNDIANDFGGGGHRCACGIKNLDASQVETLISALAQALCGREKTMKNVDFRAMFRRARPHGRSARLSGMKGHLCALLITVLIFAVHFYVSLFAIHLQDSKSAFLLLGYVVLFTLLDWLFVRPLTRLHKVLGTIAAAGFVAVLRAAAVERAALSGFRLPRSARDHADRSVQRELCRGRYVLGAGDRL